MGGSTYQNPKTPSESFERTVSDKFVTWLNGVDFKDDDEHTRTLIEIVSECNLRIQAIGEGAIDKAEAEGS